MTVFKKRCSPLPHIFFAFFLLEMLCTKPAKQSYFPQNLPYKKLFLQRMNFKLSPHSLILHLLLYDIMFYGCFSKPINFTQSAKFLPLGVLKLYSKLKIAKNALYLSSTFTWIMRHINPHIWALKHLNHLHLCLYGSLMKGGMLCLISYLNYKKVGLHQKMRGIDFPPRKKTVFRVWQKNPWNPVHLQ